MNPNLTDITVVLDKSGSMFSVLTDTIGGFNKFLKAQQEAPGEARLTLRQFSHEHSITVDNTGIAHVLPLTDETYRPNGNTALYDAIGRAVDGTGARLAAIPEAKRPGKVILVIITDGFENSSTEYTGSRIREMLKHQQDRYKWEVIYLGANQDAMAMGQQMGFMRSKSMTYAANAAGTQAAFGSVAANTTSFRSGAKADMTYTHLDYVAQAAAGASNGPVNNTPEPAKTP